MPVRLFTDAERERLEPFPRDVPPGGLLASFTRVPDDLSSAPSRVVAYLALQPRQDHRQAERIRPAANRGWKSAPVT